MTSVQAPILSNKDRRETDFEHISVIGHTEMIEVDEYKRESDNADSETDSSLDTKKSVLMLVSQPKLNDLIRDLGLPKDSAEFLASFMKQRNLLEPRTKVSLYRNRESNFRKYFSKDEDLVFCTDINGLMNKIK